MKMKVLSLQQKKIESDFLAFQYNEQIKYLTIDLNESYSNEKRKK